VTAESIHVPLLQKQLEQLQQLEQLLESEKEALTKQVPAQLVKISEEKNLLLEAIQTLDQSFEQSVQFKEGRSQGLYRAALTSIEDALIRCKEKNYINGQIIQHSQLSVERMKTSLLQSHNKSSITYDSKGKTTGGLSSLGIKA